MKLEGRCTTMKQKMVLFGCLFGLVACFGLQIPHVIAAETFEEMSTPNMLYVRGLVSAVSIEKMQISVRPPKEKRIRIIIDPDTLFDGDRTAMVDDLEQALYASKIVSYAQGYQLMRAVSEEEDWGLDFGAVALMWRGGCIIRSRFLGNIRDAFETDPELANLMLDDFFKAAIDNAQAAWRRVVVTAVKLGIPMPAIGSALAYYDGYRSERLPANLLQAQRDYFGAHTYERVDKPRGEFFHTNWTGRGGDTSASTYVV